MNSDQSPVHVQLPENGLHLFIRVPHTAGEALEDAQGGLFIDVSIEDIVATWTINHFLTAPQDSEAIDPENRPVYDMLIYSGREIRRSVEISQNALVAIRAYFSSTDFRRGLRGVEALAEFESADVKEARDTEVSLVQATWRETVAEA
jgi:hypothetical protein